MSSLDAMWSLDVDVPARAERHNEAIQPRPHMRFHRRTCHYLVAAATLIASRGAIAQAPRDSIGPRPGTWGAEASYGSGTGVSLLWFSSPRAAWMLGASYTFGEETSDQTAPAGGTIRSTNITGSLNLRVGRRWWSGELNAPMRPFVGFGVGGGLSRFSNVRSAEGSVNGELGATYFFGPHVSLGAAAELAVVRGHDRYISSFGPEQKSDRWYVRGNLARLTAAVYF